MPVFRVQLPDGRIARIDAATGDDAMAFAKNGLKPTADQQDYSAELAKARKPLALARDTEERFGLGAANAVTHQSPLPFMDELNAGLHAAGNEVVNQTVRRMTGDRPVDSGAIYRAQMAASAEDDQLRRQAHPVASNVGGLLTALVGGAPLKGAAVAAKTATGLGARAVATAKAAGIGGAYGGAYGFLDGQGEDRLTNAKMGAEAGALSGGLLEGVAAPLAEAAAPVVRDAVSGIKNLKNAGKPQLGPVVPTDDEVRGAALAAAQLAAKKGITSANVAEKAAPFAGKDPMAAEIIGPEGVTQLAATARRGGETGDSVRGKVYVRSQGAPDRIKQDFADQLGIDPEFAAGDVETMEERGRAAAKPLFDAALNRPDGIWNEDLQRLYSLPDVQSALSLAENSERIAQRGANGLTYGRVEVPQPGLDAAPLEPDAAPETVRRGPAKPPGRGPSLMSYLAKAGGLTDEGGELANMGADVAHVGKPFNRSLIGNMHPDDAALKAWEAGYFPGHAERPSVDDLFGAIGEELRGNPSYAREADQAALDRFNGKNADEEAIYRGHAGEPAPSEEDYGHVPAPQHEPAYMDAPTAATWDKVRRKIGGLIERDPLTKRTIKTGATGQRNHDLESLYGQLVSTLAGDERTPAAVPGLREALDAGGDAPRLEAAFERASGRLTNGTVRDFGKLWGSLKTDGERTAAKGALANDIMTLWGRGQLKGGKFALPGIQAKLELAFGRDQAKAFVQRMEAEAQLAASGNRAAPYSGSPTMGLGEAAKEQDAAGVRMSDIERIGGKLGHGNFLGGAADAVGTGLSRLAARGRTAGMSEGMRNEYGGILQMSPDEFAGFLAEWEKLPEATKKLFPLPAGLVAGNLNGQSQGDMRRRAP